MCSSSNRRECKEVDIEIVSLRSKIEELEKSKASLDILREALLRFKCSKNQDEEDFLHNKAIKFEKQRKARTYLIIEKGLPIAFFSLSFKSIDLLNLSQSKRKDMTAGEEDADTYSAYLIGHLAKSDNISYIMGNYILDAAIDLILEAQKIVGGRLVYLDCKNEEKLKKLYTSYGFKFFNISKKTGLYQYYLKI